MDIIVWNILMLSARDRGNAATDSCRVFVAVSQNEKNKLPTGKGWGGVL